LTWLQTDESQLMRDRVSTIERRDDAVFISLTRTATLSITTAGVIVTWQNDIDSGGNMTYSGSSITVPMAGYYLLSVLGTLGTKDDIFGDVVVNGVEVATMGTAGSKDTKFRHSIMRFYKAGDVVQYRATTKTGTMTLQVNTEDAANESPILHMVLL
jgi:hypothetical protein